MSEPATDRIIVVGGGVIGLTTAIVLQLAGYDSEIVAGALSSDARVAGPEFASIYAAASILPHSVRTERVREWVSATSTFLDPLVGQDGTGVRRQRHFEVFEGQPGSPPYLSELPGLSMIDGSEGEAPIRSGVASVGGWSFDMYFCSGPAYLQYLRSCYEDLGGQIRVGKDVSLATLVGAETRAVVNCTGFRGPESLESIALRVTDEIVVDGLQPLLDPARIRFIAGHFLRMPLPGMLEDGTGRPRSFNYTPSADVYRRLDGTPGDTYCYPRSDGWLLGGSREPAASIELAAARAAELASDGPEFFDRAGGRVRVPSAILELNRELILGMTRGGIDIAQASVRDSSWAGYGLRAERDAEESVRVAASVVTVDQRPCLVLNNYGHGGSGFTLSWGCALDVCRLLDQFGPMADVSVSYETPPEDVRDHQLFSVCEASLGRPSH